MSKSDLLAIGHYICNIHPILPNVLCMAQYQWLVKQGCCWGPRIAWVPTDATANSTRYHFLQEQVGITSLAMSLLLFLSSVEQQLQEGIEWVNGKQSSSPANRWMKWAGERQESVLAPSPLPTSLFHPHCNSFNHALKWGLREAGVNIQKRCAVLMRGVEYTLTWAWLWYWK